MSQSARKVHKSGTYEYGLALASRTTATEGKKNVAKKEEASIVTKRNGSDVRRRQRTPRRTDAKAYDETHRPDETTT